MPIRRNSSSASSRRRDSTSGDWATQLAQLYRDEGQFDAAADAATRALHRQPYNATLRELAAAISLQRGDTDTALRHLRAMTVLEPKQAIHFVRLAALYQRVGDAEKARAAAEQARQLDPDAPVDQFLK